MRSRFSGSTRTVSSRTLQDAGVRAVVLARRRPVEISVEELERIDPDDPREVDALRHNIRQLHAELRKLQDGFIWLEPENETLTEKLAQSPP